MYDSEKDILHEMNDGNENNENKQNNDFLNQEKQDKDIYINDSENEIKFLLNDDDNINKKEKPKHKSKKRLVASFLIIALLSSMLGGVVGGFLVNYQLNNNGNKDEDSSNISANQVKINLTDNIYFAAAVAEKAQKTVVGITTVSTQSYNTIFGPQTDKGRSMGSGVIVDSNGYILTNAHVVGDGQYDTITVSLIDGSTEQGTVLWYETALDLAVVKINKTGLPVAELADSGNLMVGEPVVAIGNPMSLELERTVTNGIISGLNRSIQFENGTVIKPLIQTNASINEGNSGGPLFNAEGKVIGINTAKMKSAEGLGFAIPINTANPILEQIINDGTVSSLYIGIKGVDIEVYEKALGIDITQEYGIVVIEAIKDSPAHNGGIQNGDIITEIDNNKIESMNDLKRQLFQYKDNDKVQVNIVRNNEKLTVEITLKEKPEGY